MQMFATKIKSAAAHYCTSAFNWCIHPKNPIQ